MKKCLLVSACVASLALAPAIVLAQPQVTPAGSEAPAVQTGGAAGSQTAQSSGIGGLSTGMIIGGVAATGLVIGLAVALSGDDDDDAPPATTNTTH